MTNINLESKALEMVQQELAKRVIKSVSAQIEEAVIEEMNYFWEDIFKAVIEAQPAPAVVSNDQLVEELTAEVNALREQHFQLQAQLLGMSCKLPNCPVKQMEETGEVKLPDASDDAVEGTDEPLGEEDSAIIMGDEDALLEAEHEEYLQRMREEEATMKGVYPEDEQGLGGQEEAPVPNPFAGIDINDNPFAGISLEDDDLPSEDEFLGSDLEDGNVFADAQDESLFSSMPEEPKETEAPAPTPAPTPEMPKGKSEDMPLGKDAVTVAVHNVFDKEVHFVRNNARIMSESGYVRSEAMKLHNIMIQGNTRKKPTTQAEIDSQTEGRLYTQLIREWGMEIAAINNIETVYGDDGCGILIARLSNGVGNLVAPPLRVRNEKERAELENVAKSMKDEATRKQVIAFVNTYKDTLAWNPANFTGNRELSNQERTFFGYALLYSRLKLTWANVLDKPECVFPEVKKYQLSKEVVRKAVFA